MSVNVAIVGATGAVGQEFLNVLAERKFPIRNLRLLASARSAGKEAQFSGKSYLIEELTRDSFKDIQIAFFSAGGSISRAVRRRGSNPMSYAPAILPSAPAHAPAAFTTIEALSDSPGMLTRHWPFSRSKPMTSVLAFQSPPRDFKSLRYP